MSMRERERDEAFRTEVEAAVRSAHGAERYLLSDSIEEVTAHWHRVIPPGTRVFSVAAESLTCHHHPRCQWQYLCFATATGHIVLFDVLELPSVSLAELHRRLLEKEKERRYE